MGNWLVLVFFVLVVVGLMLFSGRARRRQRDAEHTRADAIDIGTEVMTTSGLYGIVTARNDDGSVQLRIAPDVEVKWAFAALRDVTTLPGAYKPASAEIDEWPERGGETHR